MSYLEVPGHALQPGKVWSKSVSNEGHSTREYETGFRLSSLSSSATQTSDLEVTTHVPKQVKVWSKSVGTEGYFTREHERVSHLYLAHQ
jgi:hypothetical protein